MLGDEFAELGLFLGVGLNLAKSESGKRNPATKISPKQTPAVIHATATTFFNLIALQTPRYGYETSLCP